jgi:hypothetical protein
MKFEQLKFEQPKIISTDIEIISIFENTRKPTAKRVYKQKYIYKVKFLSQEFSVNNMVYDLKNKIVYLVLAIESGWVIATTIKPILKFKYTQNIHLIKGGSASYEKQIKYSTVPIVPIVNPENVL